jgi:spore germination protein YaaH
VRCLRIGVMVVLAAALEATVSLTACTMSRSSDTTSQSEPYKLSIRAGYLVPWDTRGIATIEQGNVNGGALTELSPVWYLPGDQGQIVFASQEAQISALEVEQQALSHGLAVMPSISNYRDGHWDGGLIHHLLTDPVARAAHIAAISTLVLSHGWTGIDLDYEALPSADRDAYSGFIRALSKTIHQLHKRLSLTVHAKTSEPGDWSGAKAEDWQALGASADEIRVMAYDHATGETAPGSIAPLPWVKQVLQLAVKEIPREKILLGLGAYGYDWTSSGRGTSLQWADAEQLALDHAVPPAWDTASSSSWFTYTDAQGLKHTVWYETEPSLQTKIDLARRSQIAGVFVWRLGGEDPNVWDALRRAA